MRPPPHDRAGGLPVEAVPADAQADAVGSAEGHDPAAQVGVPVHCRVAPPDLLRGEPGQQKVAAINARLREA